MREQQQFDRLLSCGGRDAIDDIRDVAGVGRMVPVRVQRPVVDGQVVSLNLSIIDPFHSNSDGAVTCSTKREWVTPSAHAEWGDPGVHPIGEPVGVREHGQALRSPRVAPTVLDDEPITRVSDQRESMPADGRLSRLPLDDGQPVALRADWPLPTVMDLSAYQYCACFDKRDLEVVDRGGGYAVVGTQGCQLGVVISGLGPPVEGPPPGRSGERR